LDTGGGEARRLFFFWRLDKNEGNKKHGKHGKKLKNWEREVVELNLLINYDCLLD